MKKATEAMEYEDMEQKNSKPMKKGSVKKMLREDRKIGTMSDTQILGYQVYRHRAFLTGAVIGVVLPYAAHVALLHLAALVK